MLRDAAQRGRVGARAQLVCAARRLSTRAGEGGAWTSNEASVGRPRRSSVGRREPTCGC